MNPNIARVLEKLKEGRVACLRSGGNSMDPVIRSGQKQYLVPVMPTERARGLGLVPYAAGTKVDEGYLTFVDPMALRVGNAVFCRVKGRYFTHEIVMIVDGKTHRLFAIAPHHRRHTNGVTSAVYGLCVRAED